MSILGNIIPDYLLSNPDKIFFTSDTHFGHKNILKYCNRPFGSVSEMDDTLIRNWNKVVDENSLVFHLGDFNFGGINFFKKIREQLNGHIVLIRGNHDTLPYKYDLTSYFEVIVPQLKIRLDQRTIYMNHFPYLCFSDGLVENVIQLFGHVHTQRNGISPDASQLKYLNTNQYDVGVDFNNYTPISWPEVQDKINYQISSNKNMIEVLNENNSSK